jgi:hypothetical protein
MKGRVEAHSPATTWIAIVLAVAAVYVFSFGPMLYLQQRNLLTWAPPQLAQGAFYRPVYFLHMLPLVKKPLSDYSEWWMTLAVEHSAGAHIHRP